MPFIIVRNDITRMRVDAIVNAANSTLLGGGGVDGAIHRAAGPKLLEECRGLHGCRTGEAKATAGYELPARYVIHTVGPIWRGGRHGEEELLRSCYENSLRLAEELGCESLAFPLVSAGVYGYPKREAIRIASESIERFLENSDMTVYLVIFERVSFEISSDLMDEVRAYLDENLPEAQTGSFQRKERRMKPESLALGKAPAARENAAREAAVCFDAAPMAACASLAEAPRELSAMLGELDESFSQNLLRRIDASGMTDAECYKRANIDRKLFSKIRSDPAYRPSKPTAIAFAVALRLDLAGTNDLLRRAGFALSRSSKFDVIVEYFITRGIHDIYTINETLFAFDQQLLGS